MENTQITTVTLLRFEGKNILWMLPQMQLSLEGFKAVEGLEFFKLMGSGGKNGFSIRPNFNVYALVGVWKNETFANSFFKTSPHFKQFKDRCKEHVTVFMHNVKAHGMWSGRNPFTDFKPHPEGLIAVITRARIKWHFIPRFWFSVPKVSRNMQSNEGLLLSIGIGEYPLFMQATFSIWESRKYMAQFAYKSTLHREVVKKTRELGWYKEELFANFIPYKTEGTWNGEDPLKTFL